MPSHVRLSPLRLAVICLFIASPAWAQPAIPGFTRFHADKPDAGGGHLVFKTLHCGRCHTKQGAPDASHLPAPILDDVGARVKRAYLRDFLNDPHKIKPGTTMPNLFAGLDADEKKNNVEALVHFLASTGTVAQTRADRKGIAAGRDLYNKVGCVACHGTRNADGDQDKLFATSVALGNLKAKYTLASLRLFLLNPHESRPHGRMPGLLNIKESGDVANYLMQGTAGPASATNMNYTYYEGSWKALPDFDKLKPVKSGEAGDFELSVARRMNECALKFDGFLKIETEGNYTFHLTSDDGSKLWINDKVVVNNDGVHPPALKSGKTKLTKGMHKLVVAVFNAGGGFELSVDVEGPGINKMPLGSMVHLREKELPIVNEKDDNSPLQPNLIKKGKELFASVGCANCHSMQKETRRLNAPGLALLKPTGGCLDAAPKKGVPSFGLSQAQQTALSALIKKPTPAKAPTSEAAIAFTMKSHNCYACHERGEGGGPEDALNKLFTTVMPEMGDEGRIPPSLNGVGAKMKAAYLKKVLEEGSHDRPYMHTRMPRFSQDVMHLVEMFAALDKAETAPKVVLPEPLNKSKFAARHLVGPQAFGCIKCHTFAGNKAEGVQGMDLAIMTQRLNHDWFFNYMINPSKYRPGTRMPSSFPDGKTPLKNILDGSADSQIEAIWAYLSDGKAATMPAGITSKNIPLIPIHEAIIYRNFIQGAGSRAIGVGYPERAHLAFDANDLRLAMIWQGAFIDAKRHWTDRGTGFEPPMGDNVIHLPTGVGFFVLPKGDEPWPTKSAKDLGYQFKGYRLTDDQRPTFLYTFNDIKIEDTPNAIETKSSPAIRRTFTLTSEAPIDRLYYRAAVADQIVAEKDGWYRVGAWRMRVDSGAPPTIRQAGKKMELLVPVRWQGNSAKIVQEYVW